MGLQNVTKQSLTNVRNNLNIEDGENVFEGQGSLACCRPWGCKESDRESLIDSI